MSNMKIWDAVSKTNPAHTKTVSLGRKFTAIDAHYQIMETTRQFGAVGIGWGYEVSHSTLESGEILLAIADVVVWHSSRENTFGPIRGVSEMINAKGRLDDDAPKKATTDALTKALSHLGFNADVFLGMFDDNKYVAKLKQEFNDKPEKAMTPDQLDAAVNSMYEAKSIDGLQAVFGKAWHEASKEQQQQLKTVYDQIKISIEGKAE